jgi:hypothetical protein
METYKVWDELNSEEQFARNISADDEYEAAILYAEEDSDGNADGIYTDETRWALSNLLRDGHPICVRTPDGGLHKFHVGIVDFTPVYEAERAET